MKQSDPTDHVHIVIQGTIQDPVAAARATKSDVLKDIRWFKTHRGVKIRHRPASGKEIQVYGLSETAMVCVCMRDDSGVVRAFYHLSKTLNERG
jgi:hypothetical protein